MEVSVLDYARQHGLCRDHRRDSAIDLDASDIRELGEEEVAGSPPDLWQSTAATTGNEAWTLDLDTALYLRDVVTVIDTEADFQGYVLESIRKLRIEPPLLASDEELEYRIFINETQKQDGACPRTSLLSTIDLEPDPPELRWPLTDNYLTDGVTVKASSESVQLDLSACQLIKGVACMEPCAIQDDQQPVKTNDIRISSPIMPLSPSPAIQFLPACEVPPALTSSPTDPGIAELRHFDEQMLAETIEQVPDSILEQVMPSCAAESPPMSTLKRHSPAEFKIEGPLTPFDSSSSPSKRIRLDTSTKQTSSDLTPISSVDDPDKDSGYLDFFNQMVDLASPAIHRAENEQLSEIDTTLRMPVPLLPDVKIIPPWYHFSMVNGPIKGWKPELDGQKCLLVATEGDLANGDRVWPITGFHRLSWIPVPIRTDLNSLLNEVLDTEAEDLYLEDLLTERIDADAFARKQPGLRLLDEHESDEDILEPMNIEVDETDMLATIASRRYEDLSVDNSVHRSKIEYAFDRPAEANDGLDRFFDLQSGRKPALSTRTHPRPQHTDPIQAAVPITPKIDALSAPTRAPLEPLPSPPSHCLMTSTLLLNRPLISSLSTLLPNMTLIERDLPPTEEADILPSPSVGIVLTTMQKIKQRPLPGSRSVIGAVQGRIAGLVRRYGRIIVLVRDGGRSSAVGEGTSRLDESDRDALKDLERSGSSTCKVDVIHVPGDEVEIARKLAEEICGAAKAVHMKLLELDRHGDEEETELELALRRAGVNVFAALAVVATLRGREAERIAKTSSAEGLELLRRILEPLIGVAAARRSMEVLHARFESDHTEAEWHRKPPTRHRLQAS